MTYYGLRDYGVEGQVGLESTLDEYLGRLVAVFEEVRRVLHPSGVAFVDMGDSYAASGRARGNGGMGPSSAKQMTNAGAYFEAVEGCEFIPSGLKAKDRMLVPFRLALQLQAAGWWVRDVIVWHKPAPMPESVTDRCTQSWEPVFMLAKSERYFFDVEALREPYAEATLPQIGQKYRGESLKGYEAARAQNPSDTKRRIIESLEQNGGRQPRNVWTIGPEPFTDTVDGLKHFAVFPSELPKRCILAGCPPTGTVLDPFAGTFTTCAVALELGRSAIGIELNPAYVELGRRRLARITPGLPLLA